MCEYRFIQHDISKMRYHNKQMLHYCILDLPRKYKANLYVLISVSSFRKQAMYKIKMPCVCFISSAAFSFE
jgi:hypothetical protein